MHELTGLSRRDIDVSEPEALRAVLFCHNYDVLVNCTGATSLEQCEDNPTLAARVNAAAPAIMAADASRRGARMIHFGTDYVFDGKLDRPYVEEDEAHPLSVYGQTKLEGELAVVRAGPEHLAVRVSWVFGPDKASFIDMILKRALRGEVVEAVADKTSCPTYTEDVAQWLEPWLGSNAAPGGIFHACNGGPASWQGFAQGALDLAVALGWPVTSRVVKPVLLSSIRAFRAARPAHTPMNCEKLECATGLGIRQWKDSLAEYLAGINDPAAWAERP